MSNLGFKRCCILCKHWSAYSGEVYTSPMGARHRMQNIRLCGVTKEETNRHYVCSKFKKDDRFIEMVYCCKRTEKIEAYKNPNL